MFLLAAVTAGAMGSSTFHGGSPVMMPPMAPISRPAVPMSRPVSPIAPINRPAAPIVMPAAKKPMPVLPRYVQGWPIWYGSLPYQSTCNNAMQFENQLSFFELPSAAFPAYCGPGFGYQPLGLSSWQAPWQAPW